MTYVATFTEARRFPAFVAYRRGELSNERSNAVRRGKRETYTPLLLRRVRQEANRHLLVQARPR